jgi:hypothetical protein
MEHWPGGIVQALTCLHALDTACISADDGSPFLDKLDIV